MEIFVPLAEENQERRSMKQFLALLICLVALPLHLAAQSQEQAKKLFNEGKFAEAEPMFEKLLKKNPRNGSLNYWFGACLYETDDERDCLPYLEQAAERDVREAHRYLALCLADRYQYAEAVEAWDDYFALMKKAKKSTDAYQQAYRQATMGKQMMRNVRTVTFIDSFVVDKGEFLTAYRLSPEAGTLESYNRFFGETAQPEGVVYQTEMKNKVYYSAVGQDSLTRLYAADLIGNNWGSGSPLNGLPEGADASYPFMMSDGITFYYAAKGDGSLGGYDIYVTRYDAEEDRYLQPENIGMPFNSPGNDYMYAVDEYNGLGWFATDRNQPEGKVCIYLFLPEENARTLDEETTDRAVLAARARIASIQATQTDADAVRKAKQRLATIIYDRPQTAQKRDFEFAIDDFTTYYTAEEFRSSRARTLFNKWIQEKKNLTTLDEKLEEKRAAYAKANATARARMAAEILDLEQRVETLEAEVEALEKSVRNEEIGGK